MTQKEKMIVLKKIQIGSTVKRLNDEHGRMEVGDEAIVVDIIGTKICLDKDFGFDFTHDITNIELVPDRKLKIYHKDVVTKRIRIGSIVKRINIPHGGMEVGDESTVVDIINNRLCLEVDWPFHFTHDIKNIMLVKTPDYV